MRTQISPTEPAFETERAPNLKASPQDDGRHVDGVVEQGSRERRPLSHLFTWTAPGPCLEFAQHACGGRSTNSDVMRKMAATTLDLVLMAAKLKVSCAKH